MYGYSEYTTDDTEVTYFSAIHACILQDDNELLLHCG